MKAFTKRVICSLLATAMVAVCTTSLTACKKDNTQNATNSSSGKSDDKSNTTDGTADKADILSEPTNTLFNYETDMQYMYYGAGVY